MPFRQDQVSSPLSLAQSAHGCCGLRVSADIIGSLLRYMRIWSSPEMIDRTKGSY
jgi:hypothetical protein